MTPSWKRSASILGTILVGGLLVFVLAPASAAASPIPAASNSSHTWAYGAIEILPNTGPRPAGNGWLVEGNATLGYTVNITEISTPPTFELIVYRTMGLAYTIRFCDLTCASPTQWANETFRAYETTVTFANFTTQGTVFQNGTGVLAIALQNTTTFLHANVTEATDVFLPLAGERGPHLGYLGANLRARSAVTFSPALGLIPDQPIPGTSWNSSSDFAATGSASWSYYYSLIRPVLPPPPVVGSGEISLSANGNVSVLGSYLTGTTPLGGTQYPTIVLTIIGPFDVREGIIFVPTVADIFGSATQPWSGNATVTTSTQAYTLNLKLSKGAVPQIIASSWKYSTAAANAATSSAVVAAPAGISAAATNTSSVGQGVVQGVPESAAQSQSNQNCLTKGLDCASPTSPRSFLGLIVVGGAVVIVAVLAAVAVVSRRRRTPPPVYPNSVLYPPGAAYPAAPAGGPATPTSPPPPEDDPLDHLW